MFSDQETEATNAPRVVWTKRTSSEMMNDQEGWRIKLFFLESVDDQINNLR
jgi:hypothetical protein